MADSPAAFYLPEDVDYTIVASALDAARFLVTVSDRDDEGRLYCRSVDAVPSGELVRYRGRMMEGVGYCADSVFGAHTLVRLGRVLRRPELGDVGWSYLDHALAGGFFDDREVPVRLYRDTETGELLDNLEGRPEYLEVGHIARVGQRLLCLADIDEDPERAERAREIGLRAARWVAGVERCANGWYPRRCTPDRAVFVHAVDALGPTDMPELAYQDPIHDRSAGGVLAIELLAEAAQHDPDLVDPLRGDVDAFVAAGGHFGSVNTDTEDLHENVGYALAFTALVAASERLDDPAVEDFAFDACLDPLRRFELVEDLNGCETKGLLYMEDSWNAACTWEIAAAAQAYAVAHQRRGQRAHLLKALTMLRGLAKHHHGDHGFLTEAVDWDGHSVATRHLDGARRGDIVTTHPFLNNLYVVEPTATVLERGVEVDGEDGAALYDIEGNRLCTLPLPLEPWMTP